MNRRRFLKGLSSFLVAPVVYRVLEPMTRIVPPVNKRYTDFKRFNELLKQEMIPAIQNMMLQDDPVWGVIKSTNPRRRLKELGK